MTLDELMIQHGSDKASIFTRTYAKPHDYCRHLERLFGPIRHQPIRLLEVGCGGGESVRGWLDYFDHPDARICSMDIVQGTNDYNTVGAKIDPRYEFVHGDQTSEEFWQRTIMHGSGWDVCVDDGLHTNIAVITTFNALWQHVKPGGFYAIEDLGVGYGGPSFFVNPCWPSQIDFIKGKIDEMNFVSSDIDSIYLSRELAVLKKKL